MSCNLLYYVWMWHPESFVKINWPEPTRLVCQTFVQDKWVDKVLDFAGFSSCVKHSNINTMLFRLINKKVTLDLCHSLICNILNPLVWCVKLSFETGGFVWDRWLVKQGGFSTVVQWPVVCYLCWLNNGAINIGNHKCYRMMLWLKSQ